MENRKLSGNEFQANIITHVRAVYYNKIAEKNVHLLHCTCTLVLLLKVNVHLHMGHSIQIIVINVVFHTVK